MKPGLKRPLLVLALIVAALAATEGLRQLSTPSPLPIPDSGDALAQLIAAPLQTPQGKTAKLSDWQNRILVVNFWATWCPPCRDEMPILSRAQDEFGPKGVQFVGIALDEAINVDEFSRSTAVSYPLLVGQSNLSGLMLKLGNKHLGLPFTIVIDRTGKHRYSHLGSMTREDLKKQIAPLL